MLKNNKLISIARQRLINSKFAYNLWLNIGKKMKWINRYSRTELFRLAEIYRKRDMTRKK